MDDKIAERLTAALEMLAKERADDSQHTKTPAQFSNYTPLHGSGGIFAVNGLERDILTAHMRPYGIDGKLPLIPTVFQDPRFGSITGFTASVGSQPDHLCDDAPYAYMKGCNLTARFGAKRFDTNTIDMDDVMLRLHRGDFTDLMLRGRVLGMTDLVPGGLNESQILNLVTMSEMVIVGVQMERALNREIWQGVVTNANEFPGLDVQIATGQEDADTGTACPALDSDVKNFGYDLVCGQAGGRDIVEYLSTLMWYLNDVADRSGASPVEWVIAMRPGLWHELSACWPCAYNTTKCASVITDANGQVVVNGTEMVNVRDQMRQGMYIDVEGRRYPVITDTGIFEHNNVNNANVPRGQYASSIYVVPLTAFGGMPITYREYLDYRLAQSDVALLKGMNQFFWTDNGVWSWAYEQVKWCYKLALKTQQRVVLRAPQLAGRIDAVRYAPLQHERDSDPSDSYFRDGGVSLRAGLGLPHAVWSGR